MSSIDVLEQIERDALENIDSTCSELLSRHQSFFATFEVEKNNINLLYRNVGLFGMPDNATLNAIRIAENNALESIKGHCNHLVEWQNYFLTFEATARTLHNSGLPQVRGRLWEIQKDLGGAFNACWEISVSIVGQSKAVLRIVQNTSREIVDAIERAHNSWVRTFDDFLKRWSDTTFNKCPYCGFFLDSRSFPYCRYCKVLVRQ